jgi:hypothetical protein
MSRIKSSESRGSNIVVSHVFGDPDGYAQYRDADGYGGKTTVNASTPVEIDVLPERQYRIWADVNIYFQFSEDGEEPVLDDGYGVPMTAELPEVWRTAKNHNTLSVLGSAAGSVWVNEMRDQ